MNTSLIAETYVTSARGARKVRKPWGREIIVQSRDLVVKLIEVDEGKRTSLQYHKRKIETILPFEGKGGIELDGKRILGPITIMPGLKHRAVGPVKFIEISTDELDDVVRVEDDFGREGEEKESFSGFGTQDLKTRKERRT